MTAELCRKLIRHCNGVINACVHEHMTDMNDVGEWTQEQIDSIVLPVAGDMDEDEVTTLDNMADLDVFDNVIIDLGEEI